MVLAPTGTTITIITLPAMNGGPATARCASCNTCTCLAITSTKHPIPCFCSACLRSPSAPTCQPRHGARCPKGRCHSSSVHLASDPAATAVASGDLFSTPQDHSMHSQSLRGHDAFYARLLHSLLPYSDMLLFFLMPYHPAQPL